MLRTTSTRLVITIVALLVLPGIAFAQSATSGAIAGVARDATGAVLPGVTVEAASPALIEKIRTVLTDGTGNYKVVDLRPGVYSVTFSLAGFSSYTVEGVELTTGITAVANGELKLGSLEESVTVKGAPPIVDVQNVRTQNVLSRSVLDALPTAQTTQGFATLTLGATVTGAAGTGQDVGGNNMESNNTIAIHGNRGQDARLKLDGMGFNSNHGEGGGIMTIYVHNQAAIQEVVLETGGISAESETGGIQLNAVPKDGGNEFRTYVNLAYTNEHLTSGADLPDDIVARGLTSAPSTKQVWDYQFGVGGPIKKDRIWFYASQRWWGSQQYAPGNYFNSTPNTMFYTPDLDRPAYIDQPYMDTGVRVTWQVARSHKITLAENRQHSCDCWSSTLNLASPETSGNWDQGPHYLTQATWTHPRTARLLFEAGVSLGYFPINQFNDDQTSAGINITELSNGRVYGAPATLTGAGGGDSFLGRELYGLQTGVSHNFNERLSASYITGSHAFRVGLTVKQGHHDQPVWVPNELNYQFRNGTPVGLVQRVSPLVTRERLLNTGLFAQDQWTLRNLTLTLGARFDAMQGSTLPEQIVPTRFVAPFDVPAVEDIPSWKNITPRIGVAYDLFGDGKTAVKFSLGQYMVGHASDMTTPNHPANSIVTSTPRSWTDGNGNFVPDCDLNVRGQSGECGPISNNAFGTSVVTTRYGDEVLRGWNARDYNWQTAAVLQHELKPGVGMTIGYFRSSYGNLWTLSNEAVSAADFDEFCVNLPVDSRLPDGGGQQQCGFYDVSPAKFGQVRNLVTQASRFGQQTEVFNGVDLGMNVRYRADGLIQGGVSTGRKVTDVCYAGDSPNLSPSGIGGFGFNAFARTHRDFCRVSPPWSAGTQIKLAGTYRLPGQMDVSATFQNLPGSARTGTMVVSSADVAPSLGRDLSAGPAATTVVQILPNQTYFEDRITQLDLRLTKNLRIGRGTLRGAFDIYNIFSARAVLASNGRYGPSFLTPTAVMAPRLFKFGGQMNW